MQLPLNNGEIKKDGSNDFSDADIKARLK
ncbi:protein of unknown function [Lactiplantibacillus plantarum]